jgi:Na+/H+ antiporter NhaC
MLIPLLVVIVLALSGKSIFAALTSGIVTGAVVSLLAGILTPADFLRIKDGGVTGIIPSGVGGVFGAIMVYIGIMAMLGVVRKSGALERMVEWLVARVAGTPRGCEATIFVMAWLMDILNAGITTSVVAIVGPIANTLGKRQRLHPYRRANLVDGVGNSWAYFIPWSAFIFIVLGIVGSMKQAYPFLVVPAPTSFFFAVFHAWFLWIVFLTAVVTGFGREFEGEGGRRILAWFKNCIPEEALRP